jgi:hypothetical protein
VLTDSTGRERRLNLLHAIWTIQQLDTKLHADSTKWLFTASKCRAGQLRTAARHSHVVFFLLFDDGHLSGRSY